MNRAEEGVSDGELPAERRGWERKGQKLQVIYRVTGAPDASERIGRVADLTTKGMGFVTKGSIPVGSAISLRVTGSGAVKSFRGTVRWTSAISDTGDYRIGVKFTDESGKTAPLPAVKVTAENRKFPRRAVKLLVKLRCVTSGIEHETVDRGGMLVNISKSGMEVVTTRDYAKGAVLEVTMPESELGPGRKLHARVAWSKATEQPGRVGVGASFVRLSEPPPPEGL